MGRKRKFDLKWAGRPQPEIRAGISPLLVAGSCIYLILYSFFSSLRSEANIQMSEMIGLKKIHRDEEWEEAQSEERGYRLEWDEPFLMRTKETCFFPKTLRHWATSSFQCHENGPLISPGGENRYSLPVFFPSINIGLTFGLNILSTHISFFI
jgi:hypothetical protein